MVGGSVNDQMEMAGAGWDSTTKTVGRMDYRPSDNNWSTEVAVQEYPGGAGLAVWVGPVLIDVLLLPDDVDDLIDDLEAAKDGFDAEIVAEIEEYVEEYSDTDNYSSSSSSPSK